MHANKKEKEKESRKENYNHSNFLFYNNNYNYNKKRAGVALFVVSARPALYEKIKISQKLNFLPPCCLFEGNKRGFCVCW